MISLMMDYGKIIDSPNTPEKARAVAIQQFEDLGRRLREADGDGKGKKEIVIEYMFKIRRLRGYYSIS